MYIEHHLPDHEHTLPGARNLGDVREITLDDESADHFARNLDIGAAVIVRVIPAGTAVSDHVRSSVQSARHPLPANKIGSTIANDGRHAE
jgi:hypothetical protein